MRGNFVVSIALLFACTLLAGQSASRGSEEKILVNASDTKWETAKNGAESITLREDTKTGATELLARYPAGHVFVPHWHDANERIILIEGRLAMEENGEKKILEPGGYAYLPARQVQRMSCVSATRCSFYVSWDGPPKSHLVEQQ
jgi:quercetin dioxygenase-like cupin family protein